MLKTIARRGLVPLAALALTVAAAAFSAEAAFAQNIAEKDPNLSQTWTGKVVYKDTAGSNWGVVGVYNKSEHYAKEFKFKKEEFDKLDVKDGDEVEVTWTGPRNDRTERKDVKIRKMSAGESSS
jgi:hypothetical protein